MIKKLIFWIVIVLIVYHFRHKILSIPIIEDVINNDIIQSLTHKVGQNVSGVLSEQKVTDELKTWVLKDGVKLPKDWVLKEKTFGTQKVTIMVPPKPNSQNDFIALYVDDAAISKLPENLTCKKNGTTSTCLVGNNYDTLKVFSIMTFVK